MSKTCIAAATRAASAGERANGPRDGSIPRRPALKAGLARA
ncbi:hypothetical protein [Sphingomonas sp. KR3-1]